MVASMNKSSQENRREEHPLKSWTWLLGGIAVTVLAVKIKKPLISAGLYAASILMCWQSGKQITINNPPQQDVKNTSVIVASEVADTPDTDQRKFASSVRPDREEITQRR